MFEHEKRIRELIQKFGLTRKEAEGLFEESKEWTGIKNLSFSLSLTSTHTLNPLPFTYYPPPLSLTYIQLHTYKQSNKQQNNKPKHNLKR
jgi:hypothetical protein